MFVIMSIYNYALNCVHLDINGSYDYDRQPLVGTKSVSAWPVELLDTKW